MSEAITWLGIISGLISLFMGFVALFLYFKVRKLFTLLNEEQLKEVAPIINSQNKKIKICLILCVVLGVIAVISLFI
ncbi:MAG: hypothetical protein IKC16_00255 [Clostridia bacterium]|nr:hypothetical protein [Clostridia bacterium]